MSIPTLTVRDNIPSSIETLPEPLRSSNAAGFLKIVEQLKQSYIAMLELQTMVSRVDVGDREAVTDLVINLDAYVDVNTGELNEDRTRCGNIRRTARTMSLDAPEAASVKEMINVLGSADDEFVYELERAAHAALDAARKIAAATLTAEAAGAKQTFVDATAAHKTKIKSQLATMNRIANALLDSI